MRRVQGSSRDRGPVVSSLESSDMASHTTGSNSRPRSTSRSDKDRHMRVSQARSAAALNRVQEVEVKNSQLQRYKESAREKTAELDRCMEEMGQKRSEEHTSELQSIMRISYAVFCLKKKKRQTPN